MAILLILLQLAIVLAMIFIGARVGGIKMGRTQLQDAVPMTSGQEFNAYANNLEEEILNLERNVKLLLEKGLMTQEKLDEALDPENMLRPL